MRRVLFPLSGAVLLLLTSCTEAPQPVATKEPEKAPEPVTGQSALFKMFQVAKSWAQDATVLKLNSIVLSEVKDVPRGKAAAWQATFASASRSQAKSFTYSIVEAEGNLHKGVFGGLDESWSGPRPGVAEPFLIQAVKIDTPDAFETAAKQAGDYDKKSPGKTISFVLEKVAKFPDPVWRVVWGESVGTSNFSVYVDAMTGEFKEKMH